VRLRAPADVPVTVRFMKKKKHPTDCYCLTCKPFDLDRALSAHQRFWQEEVLMFGDDPDEQHRFANA
jgi:hypothetical protein